MNTFNLSKHFFPVDGESDRIDSQSQVVHLIAGLERQKDELGAVAFELIDLLHRLGIREMHSQPFLQSPQNNSKT